MGYAIKIGGTGTLSQTDRAKVETIYNRVTTNSTLIGNIRDSWLTTSEFNNLLTNQWFYKCFIGQEVAITNSAATTTTAISWRIIDRGHERSGNSFDLMSFIPVHNMKLSSANYVSSTDRIWLNGTFYDRFNDQIKQWLIPMPIVMYYDKNNIFTVYDKVKLPSCTELDATWLTSKIGFADGEKYRLLGNGTGVVKAAANCWLRSKYNTTSRWIVEYARGRVVQKKATTTSCGLMPIIRVANNKSNPNL